MFIHGRTNQHVVIFILFTGWVLAPFLGLAWADRLASSWPDAARTILYSLMLLVSLGSLAVYGYDLATGYGRAVLFVAVPVVAWVVILVGLPIAVARGRRSIPRV